MKRHRALILLAILTLCISCDHASKQLAESTLQGGVISLAGDAVRLELAYNQGAFMSLGASLPPAVRGFAFLLLTPVLMALVCVLALASGLESRLGLLGLALIAGGGTGNWLDRLMHDGAVTDFVSLGLGPLRTGIFNVADVCIVVGVALLAFGSRRASPDVEAPAA